MFAIATGLAATILTGLAPALRAGGRASARGASANKEKLVFRNVLLMVQIALCTALLTGSLLFAASFRNLMSADLGFQTAGVLAMNAFLDAKTFNNEDRRALALEELYRGLQSMPGATGVAQSSNIPLGGNGWDLDANGLFGAPEIRVVVSETVHITVLKALRLLGFGMQRIVRAPVDEFGRIDPTRLPPLDDRTILCLQAGEVNTGEFDPFEPLIAQARAAGTWVHVDGAFGIWARSSEKLQHLTQGVDGADSWTTDGHKWLNTPYDGAMAICRDADALAAAMNSDAAYASASKDSQKNLTLEFSRRARGIAIWAALRTLGRTGVAQLVERHCAQAARLAEGVRAAGYEVLNRVVINQVLVRDGTDDATRAAREAAIANGAIWFGATIWKGRPAFRLSVSSWRTTDADIDRAIEVLKRAREKASESSAT